MLTYRTGMAEIRKQEQHKEHHKEQQQTLDLLLDSARLLERRLSTALANIRGISFSEYRIVASLASEVGGRATRVDLASAVGLTPSAITRALVPLEKLGYITTEKSARDARRSLAVLTPAGVELHKDAVAVVSDVLNTLPMNLLPLNQLANFHQQLLATPGRPTPSIPKQPQ